MYPQMQSLQTLAPGKNLVNGAKHGITSTSEEPSKGKEETG